MKGEFKMNIEAEKIIQIYKEELAEAKHEAIMRRALQVQLEEEIVKLKERISELEKEM